MVYFWLCRCCGPPAVFPGSLSIRSRECRRRTLPDKCNSLVSSLPSSRHCTGYVNGCSVLQIRGGRPGFLIYDEAPAGCSACGGFRPPDFSYSILCRRPQMGAPRLAGRRPASFFRREAPSLRSGGPPKAAAHPWAISFTRISFSPGWSRSEVRPLVSMMLSTVV